MATDPGMLQSWYQDYTKDKGAAAPAATTGPVAAAGPRADGLDQRAIDADPAGFAKWQAGKAAFDAGTPAPAATAGGMLTTTAAPAPFTPAQATATQWKPDEASTVAGQVNKLTAAGSPLIDQATTAAKQQSASRGLLNSTMGITAGLDAGYRAALPIAQQDANTNASAGQFNAGQANTTSQFNAGAANDVGMQREGFAQQDRLQSADFAQQDRTQAADLASRYNLANMDVQSRAALQQADFANQQKLQQADAVLRTGLQATDNAVKQSMQAYDAALKQSMQGLDNQSRLQIATLDADNRTKLAEMEAKYKNELQASQSMAASYQSMVDSYTRVMLNPDLDADAKKTVTGNITQLYENTLRMQSDVSGLELGTILGAPDDGAADSAEKPAPLVPKLKPVEAPAPSPRDDFLGGFNDNGVNSGP